MSTLPAPSPETERRTALLRELADIGMNIARALGNEAMETDARADVALRFARVAKAVRQTLALEVLVEEGRVGETRRQAANVADPAADALGPKPFASSHWRVNKSLSPIDQLGHERLCEVVDFLEDAESPVDYYKGIVEELRDWADGRDDYPAFIHATWSDIVARICADLDLPPEWGAKALDEHVNQALPYQRERRAARAAGPPPAALEAAALNTS